MVYNNQIMQNQLNQLDNQNNLIQTSNIVSKN